MYQQGYCILWIVLNRKPLIQPNVKEQGRQEVTRIWKDLHEEAQLLLLQWPDRRKHGKPSLSLFFPLSLSSSHPLLGSPFGPIHLKARQTLGDTLHRGQSIGCWTLIRMNKGRERIYRMLDIDQNEQR